MIYYNAVQDNTMQYNTMQCKITVQMQQTVGDFLE